MLFKGGARHDATAIAELFDELGAELNAATAKDSTLLYARVLDDHLPIALDVMSDMLRSPTLDGDRAGARGRARGDRDGRGRAAGRRARPRHARDVRRRRPARPSDPRRADGDRDRRRSRTSPSSIARPTAIPSIVLAAAGNVDHDAALRARRVAARPVRRGGRAAAPSLGGRSAARSPVPAQGDRAVPRLRLRPGSRPRRRRSLRALAARRDARRHGVVAALPGDPRAPRHGLLGLLLPLGLRRVRPGRGVRRDATREPRGVPLDRARGDRRAGGGRPAPGRARAREAAPHGPSCCCRSSRRPRACRGSART